MQINRLFEIVYLLIDKKCITANELAERFEVSKRTILRDIDALSEAGIPVYTMRGKGGGIFIYDNFVLNKTLLTEDEQNQIIFALQSMSVTRHLETKNTLSRLQSLFEKQGTDWIEVDFSRWGNSVEDKAKFETLKNAIIGKRVLSFTYFNSSGEKSGRKAQPHKLVFKSKSWYLQAFCLLKNNYRLFKISRMRDVEILDERFSGEKLQLPDIEASEYPPGGLIDVKLLFSPEAAFRVYDEFEEQYITRTEDGSYIVSVILPHDYWTYDYILSFGIHAVVLEPQHVRDEIVRHIEKLKDKYA